MKLILILFSQLPLLVISQVKMEFNSINNKELYVIKLNSTNRVPIYKMSKSSISPSYLETTYNFDTLTHIELDSIPPAYNFSSLNTEPIFFVIPYPKNGDVWISPYHGTMKDGKFWSGYKYEYDKNSLLYRIQEWDQGEFQRCLIPLSSITLYNPTDSTLYFKLSEKNTESLTNLMELTY